MTVKRKRCRIAMVVVVPLFAIFGYASLLAVGNAPLILPDDGSPGTDRHQIVWPTEPGHRYQVEQSPDLLNWEQPAELLIEADGLSEAFTFDINEVDQQFFRIRTMDEQAPKIVKRFPKENAYGIGRYQELSIVLADATDIDPNSLSLRVGDLGFFILWDSELTLSDNTITFKTKNGTSLGEYGETIDLLLTVSDVFGNSQLYEWSFDLEPDFVTSAEVFVFGSIDARSQGQLVGDIPASLLAERLENSVIPIDETTNPWWIESVKSSEIILAYSNAPPAFSTNTYVSNLAPANVNEIFYRKITRVTNDSENKRLVLAAGEIPLGTFVSQGSFVMDEELPAWLLTNENGMIESVVPLIDQMTEPIGFSLDGAELILKGILNADTGKMETSGYELRVDESFKNIGSGTEWLTLNVDEMSWWFQPYFHSRLEIDSTRMKRLEAVVSGTLNNVVLVNVDALDAGITGEMTVFDLSDRIQDRWVFLGMIGELPLYARIEFEFEVSINVTVGSASNFRAGVRQNAELKFGLDYDRYEVPNMIWVGDASSGPSEDFWPDEKPADEASIVFKVEPRAEFYIHGFMGGGGFIETINDVSFEKDNMQEPELTGRVRANTKILTERPFGHEIIRMLADPPLRCRYEEMVHLENHWLFPENDELIVEIVPVEKTLNLGDTFQIACTVNNSERLSYQWYKDGRLLPGETRASIDLVNVDGRHEGDYNVRVKNRIGEVVSSSISNITVVDNENPVPEGFAIVPAGLFFMGDSFGDGKDDEFPYHEVYVSSFHMSKVEVTNEKMVEVLNWADSEGQLTIAGMDVNNAIGNGQRLLNLEGEVQWSGVRFEVEQGREDFPCDHVTWYGAVAYANFKSIMEGFNPCYNLNDWSCDFSQNGYRLPTEAEWEKAARGGQSGKRFPWGDVAYPNRANYEYDSSTSYWETGVCPVSGFRPTWLNNGRPNKTSAVGTFSANGYGLYDIVGNVREWCWDRYDEKYYLTASFENPIGPDTGSSRVLRGAGWWYSSKYLSVSRREREHPLNNDSVTGFRLVRNFEGDEPLQFAIQPRDKTWYEGRSVGFESSINQEEGVSLNWYKDGILIPGETDRILEIDDLTLVDAGAYFVRAINSQGTEVDSEIATLTIIERPTELLFAKIPEGSFMMGDGFGEGLTAERPVHEVILPSYFIKTTEATNLEVAEVLNWAYERRLINVSSTQVENAFGDVQSLLSLGDPGQDIEFDKSQRIFRVVAGKENYPRPLFWHGALAFANFQSLMEGKDPCYSFDDWSSNFITNGYRLPTEAEWEKAARGGLEGKRFPWGDTISHSQANYKSWSGLSYDVSATRGYHPDWKVDRFAGESPVATFEPNGYGLYDVVGNLSELCMDRFDEDYYSISPKYDPRGPNSGIHKVRRGGSSSLEADECTVSFRGRFGSYGGVRLVYADPESPAQEQFVLIDEGTFSMGDSFGEGDSDELPVHDVYASSYYIQTTEVTNGQFTYVLNWALEEGHATMTETIIRLDPYRTRSVWTLTNTVGDSQELLNLGSSFNEVLWNGSKFVVAENGGKDNFPCSNVSWYGAVAYANFKSLMEGKAPCYNFGTWTWNVDANGYRLPTEAEWEKAARGGLEGKRFPWGDTISHDMANYYSNEEDDFDVSLTKGSHPFWRDNGLASVVGSFPANDYGLFDVAGNVWEWCHDWYADDYYNEGLLMDPVGPDFGERRVLRGGSESNYGGDARLAKRGDFYEPRQSYRTVGFRVVRSVSGGNILTFIHSSRNERLHKGESLQFSCSVNRSENVSYQWYKDGTLLSGETRTSLEITDVNRTHSGDYIVRVSTPDDGYIESEIANLTVFGDVAPVPEEFVLIPEGAFLMGDSFSEGEADELPVHEVFVSSSYMQPTEVTNRQMVEVLNVALENGDVTVEGEKYVVFVSENVRILNLFRINWTGTVFVAESGMEDSPCTSVSWYGAAIYANLKSVIDGLAPCYNLDNWSCSFTANGYRLPTEAEWEKAARGGLEGKRFPLGDTISHSQANYETFPSTYSYDLGPYLNLNRYHPDWGEGPSAVTSFPANNYGIFEVTGNVSEWCNDWYDEVYYSYSQEMDPVGADVGDFRSVRGGSYYDAALDARVSRRGSDRPRDGNRGFRLVRRKP